MSDTVPTTDGDQPVVTGGDEPAATQPQGVPAATDDSDKVTLSQEDYKNLIAQRDRANNSASESDEFVLTLAKERQIGDFLQKNKEKYPDVTQEILMSASDPDELEELATLHQNTITAAVQKKLLEVQTSTPPRLSPQEKSEKLKALKNDPGSGSFQKMLDVQQS